MSETVAKYEVGGKTVELSKEIVKKYICPLASDAEVYSFLALAKAQNLNPFIKEVYLIKYAADAPAAIVVGKETFLKRANRHPAYKGFKAGVIVSVKGKEGPEIRYKEGGAVFPHEALLGGWCEVMRNDREMPARIEVALPEYEGHKKDGTITKMWDGKQATMIRKVAVVQAHREAFPDELGGVYAPEEMRTIDITDLPEYSLDKPQQGHIEPPKEKTPPREPTPQNGEKVQDRLATELALYCNNDLAAMEDLLKGLTLFEGKDKDGNPAQQWMHVDKIAKVSDKWATQILGKLHDLMKQEPAA